MSFRALRLALRARSGRLREESVWAGGADHNATPDQPQRTPFPQAARSELREIPRPAKRGEGGAKRRVRGAPHPPFGHLLPARRGEGLRMRSLAPQAGEGLL